MHPSLDAAASLGEQASRLSSLEQRPFGRTGEQVTAISLGGVGLPRVSFADGVATVQRALALGINYLDTAPLYSRGLAQAILGVALEGRQEPHLRAAELDACLSAFNYGAINRAGRTG